MLELIIVSHTLIPINTDTYLSILYKDTVQMCISTLVSDIEKSHMTNQEQDVKYRETLEQVGECRLEVQVAGGKHKHAENIS